MASDAAILIMNYDSTLGFTAQQNITAVLS